MSKVTYVGQLDVNELAECLVRAEEWLLEHGELPSEAEVREIVARYEEPMEELASVP